jgi:HSP20 family protein
MYDRFFEPDFMSAASVFGKEKWGPKWDVSEGRNNIIVKAEIPGIEAKDLDISIDGRLLNIRGEKKQEQTDEEETFCRVESSYGYFNRTIELPAEADPNKVDASYKKGILKIKLRKTKSSETKRIKVTSG